MTTIVRICSFAISCAIALAISGCEMCGTRAPIRMIDHACLPAGISPSEIPLYRQDINRQYVQIAHIDSYTCREPGDAEVQDMLNDLKNKARAAGADAVIRVKMLSNKRTGYIDNPRTPFRSVQQGSWEDHFFRGIAIKFTGRPSGDTEEVQEPSLPPPPPEIPATRVYHRRLRPGDIPVGANQAPQPVFPRVQAPAH
jgi:hypothetical protein